MIKVTIPVQPVQLVEQGEKIQGYHLGSFWTVEEPGGPDVGTFTNPIFEALLKAGFTPENTSNIVFVMEGRGPRFNDVRDEPVTPIES